MPPIRDSFWLEQNVCNLSVSMYFDLNSFELANPVVSYLMYTTVCSKQDKLNFELFIIALAAEIVILWSESHEEFLFHWDKKSEKVSFREFLNADEIHR